MARKRGMGERRRRRKALQQRPHLLRHGEGALDPAKGVRLLSWNLAKRPRVREELQQYLDEADLICVQEARPSLLPEVPGSVHFARSFRTFGRMEDFHGVATLARAATRARGQALATRWREGWIVTPKMALATEYEFGDESLLVVNVHAFNFQPVFKYMLREQFEMIAERIQGHEGPAVVCGDFNTWREDRLRLIENLLEGFEPVDFEPSSHRKTGHWVASLALGDRSMPLDHVYVRDLTWSNARVLPSAHSDHGALSVHLLGRAPDART
ncbi:MAG: endonuclease/exonuclease/phosphatase family protein [Planctomycetota bacterium]